MKNWQRETRKKKGKTRPKAQVLILPKGTDWHLQSVMLEELMADTFQMMKAVEVGAEYGTDTLTSMPVQSYYNIVLSGSSKYL